MLLKKPDKNRILAILAMISILPLLILMLYSLRIVFSYTGSIPIGFYRIESSFSNIKQGDYISFCLSNAVAKIGMQRGYTHSGSCKNGSEELIKEVIAVPGDTVILSDDRFIVSSLSSKITYIAPSKTIDKNHLYVYRFIKNGIYHSKGYWVYGFNSPKYSWDSRYYGEIPQENVKHKLFLLWAF